MSSSVTIAVKREEKEVFSVKQTRLKYRLWRDTNLPMISIFWGIVVFVYPPSIFLALYFVLLSYYINIHRFFFSDKEVYAKYKRMLMPKVQLKHYFDIGVMIYPEDLEKVIGKIEEGIYEQEKIRRRYPHRVVGISKSSLTTHYWILGTTGAGKTSLLMTMFQGHIKNGGGLIFVDGKSDSKMFAKLYSIAKEAGRETDVYLINFLKPEKKPDTNTYNPIASLTPQQATEFLSSLMGEASGDASYWQGRGIVLLRPIIYFLGFRKRFYGETYSYETVKNYLSFREFSFMSMVAVALMNAFNRKLSEDENLLPFIKEARLMMVSNSEYEYVELLDTYFKQKPQDIAKFVALGYDFKYLENLYQVYKLSLIQYIADISSDWKDGTLYIGNLFAKYLYDAGRDILSMSIRDIMKEFKVFEDDFLSSLPTRMDRISAKKAEEMKRKYYEVDPDALQQMAYGQQQWTNIFSSLEVFSHIFGALDPDVDFDDVIRNNKILYVLLPPLEQSANTTEILGKMMVTSIRQTASVALGGDVELTETQRTILQNQISPKPLMIVTLDEYGAYPVEGIDVILAQVRSINISTLISTQDFTSGRVKGKDENSVKRLWANSQKIILRIKDDETIKKLEDALPEVKVQKHRKKDYQYTQEKELDMEYEREKIIDAKILQAMKDGLGIIMTDDEPVFFHAFWADAPESNDIVLTRFEVA